MSGYVNDSKLSQVQLSNPHQPTPTCCFFCYFPEVVCGLFLSTTFSFCMKWKRYNFRNTSKTFKGLRCGRTTCDKMETDCEGTCAQLITDLKHENHVFIQR